MSNTLPSVTELGPNASTLTNGVHTSASNAVAAVSLLEVHFNSLADRLSAEVALVSTYERKIPVLREGSVLLDEDVMELTRRLDKAQRLLIQKEAERMFIENMAEFIRERTMDTQREMDDIRSILAQVSPGFVPSQPPHSHATRMTSPAAPMPQSALPSAPSQHHSSTHNSHHLQQQQQQQIQHHHQDRERDRDRDHSHSHSHSQRYHPVPPSQHTQPQSMQTTEIPCIDFNKLGCTNTTCARPHMCVYCHSTSHGFLACDQKGCICVYYNKNECDISKCSRINICLYCLNDHPISRCPEISEDARNSMKDICNNWNAMSFCRLHRCLRCSEKHTTFECPLNVETYFSNPSITRIYSLYKSKVIIVRHEPYNSRYGTSSGGGGGGGGSSKSVGSSRGYRDETSGGGDRWVAADRDRDRDRGDRSDRDRASDRDRGVSDYRSGGGSTGDRDRDSGSSRREDEYRKRVRDDDVIGSGSSWRSGDDRGGDERGSGDLKRARNNDEEAGSRQTSSGGGGRYSKRRDDESSGKGTPPRRDDGLPSRRRERSPEKGFAASLEDDERKQTRERSLVGSLPAASSGSV
ncbi:hypothetical protein HDU80_007540 [Chytriomyces hyalinus]|nr:hypothetical protein HDU80_007540 [Chytriomyces hyalinus]